MDISYDDFIRTTEPRHEKAVQKIFTTLLRKGWYLLSSMKVGILFPMNATESQLTKFIVMKMVQVTGGKAPSVLKLN